MILIMMIDGGGDNDDDDEDDVIAVYWLLRVPATRKVCPRDESAWTVLPAATCRYKCQNKLSMSPSHNIMALTKRPAG